MRKLGIAALIVIVLLVAAVLIVPHLIAISRYHGQIQAQLQQRLGRPVSLGEMGLSLLPPSFQVRNVVIAEDSRFSTGQPFVTAEKLAVSVKLWPLLRKEVEIKSLQLQRPRVELVRDAQGTWNFASLGAAPAGAAQAPETRQPTPTPATKQPAEQFSLASLNIRDGQVAVTDEQKRHPRAVYDHIDLDLTDFAPDKPFSMKATAHLPGKGKQDVSLEGTGGPLNKQGDLASTPFDGTLRLNQAGISAVQNFLNLPALTGTDGLLSGEAKVKSSAGKLASSGSLRLENAHIRGLDVGYPIIADYDVADDLANGLIQIHRGQLKLGPTPISIAGTLNTQPTPAQADLQVSAANASIAELARLASAFGVAFGKGMDVKGQLNANVQARGAANNPSLNGHVSARNLDIQGKQIPQPVKVDAIELALTPDTIRSNDFTASSGSTSVTANFALSQYTTPRSAIDARLRAPNARIGDLLNIAQAAGVSAVEGMSGDGVLALDVHAQGPSKNLSALVFNGTGKIQNASLKLPALTKPVQIRNSDIRFSQNAATLDNIAASVGQTNASGTLTLKDFAAPQVQFALNADKVNVAELRQMVGASPAPAKHADARQDFWRIRPQAQAETSSQGSMLSKMTGGGSVSIGTVQYDDLVLNNVNSKVTLDHGVIQLNPLTADLYGGKEAGTAVIDVRPAQPVYTVNLKTANVDANKLLSSVSSVKQTLYGLLAANVNANFSATSADSIARSLNGKVGVNLTNGKLMNVDLLHELASVGKFLGNVPSAPKGFTNIVQLAGNFDVKNGVAQTRDLKAVTDAGTMAAAGLINLADQSLYLHVTAVLDKALSQQVGGNQIGGFMNTALANNQGELVLPVIVTGTFQHPMVAPDMQQIAQMKLQNLVPTSKSLGALLGNKGGTTGQQQGGIEGILGALGGKQQQQQQGGPGISKKPSQQPPTQQPQQNPNSWGNVLNQVLGQKTPTPAPTPPK
jgi:AsmA protein